MSHWQTFRRLRWHDWTLLSKALWVVVLVRLGLSLLPFRFLRRMITGLRNGTLRSDSRTPARLAWAVAKTSRLVPWATCLTQALATQVLLTRTGYQGVLHIGVAFDDAHELKAHAWLECQGCIIIGGNGQRHFTPLPPLKAGPQ